MKNLRKIASNLFIAGQPTEEELADIRSTGFRTIINLRESDEEGIVTGEERLVETAGLNYAAIPITPQTINDVAVQRFIQAVDSDDAPPVVAHCGSGGRAGIMVLLHLAIDYGWSVEQTLSEGEKLGIAPGPDSPYRSFVEDYIRRHSPAERSDEE
ncbi:MAG TPA: protein tyrosine phosphatase family protein [Abditibacteriaceae bacterium]